MGPSAKLGVVRCATAEGFIRSYLFPRRCSPVPVADAEGEDRLACPGCTSSWETSNSLTKSPAPLRKTSHSTRQLLRPRSSLEATSVALPKNLHDLPSPVARVHRARCIVALPDFSALARLPCEGRGVGAPFRKASRDIATTGLVRLPRGARSRQTLHASQKHEPADCRNRNNPRVPAIVTTPGRFGASNLNN